MFYIFNYILFLKLKIKIKSKNTVFQIFKYEKKH